MEKVTFNSLILEITHRCNMSCAHCLRGDAENMDMTPETVDALLDQTQAIYDLTLSGGEPFINLDLVEYIAAAIEKKGVELWNFCVISNALIVDARIIKAIKKFARIVNASRKRCGLKPRPETTVFGISMDKFHEYQDIVQENAKKYENAFRGTVDIMIKQCGNAPSAGGRAKEKSTGLLTEELPRLRFARISTTCSAAKTRRQ